MQIFLEGKLQGVDDCLLAPATRDAHQVFSGRSHWISLLSETLPRALLAELGLAKILLGSSGGGRFLLVLPEETREASDAFLKAAAAEIAQLNIQFCKAPLCGLPPRFFLKGQSIISMATRFCWRFYLSSPLGSLLRSNRSSPTFYRQLPRLSPQCLSIGICGELQP